MDKVQSTQEPCDFLIL